MSFFIINSYQKPIKEYRIMVENISEANHLRIHAKELIDTSIYKALSNLNDTSAIHAFINKLAHIDTIKQNLIENAVFQNEIKSVNILGKLIDSFILECKKTVVPDSKKSMKSRLENYKKISDMYTFLNNSSQDYITIQISNRNDLNLQLTERTNYLFILYIIVEIVLFIVCILLGLLFANKISTSINKEIQVREETQEKLVGVNTELQKDIEAREKAEARSYELLEELSRSNRELEQFAYIASHDLQEPLRMVASYLKLIEKRYKEVLDKDGLEFIDFAVDGAKRMLGLIHDLLKYSRVGTKKLPFEPTNCDEVYEKAIKNLEIAIDDHKAKITHDKLPQIFADEGQLVQCFQNLIANALKFCRDKTPEVHVSAEQNGNDWIFAFRDNGIGIAPEYQERVFHIFQRLHGREKYDGSGIGLSICKKIVERHGGKIWIESEVDKGTTFRFTLPVQKNEYNEYTDIACRG